MEIICKGSYDNLKIQLLSTLNNLVNFFKNSFKISRIHKTLYTHTDKRINFSFTHESIETDLIIKVIIADVNGLVAGALPTFFQAEDLRPTEGFLLVTPKIIENNSNYNNNSFFFNILFHECVHLLGFVPDHFKNWLNKETCKEWGDDFPLTNYINPKYPEKNFSILHTPNLHEYSKKRFNRTEFAPGIPMGILLEDNGGSGTKGAHPEIDNYIGDLMVGMFIGGRVYITDLVLNIIEDMGWYSVNFSIGETLTYGSGESFGSSPLINFTTETPYKSYPEHYLCQEKDFEDRLVCSHDYLSLSSCTGYNTDCNEQYYENDPICSNKEWNHPQNPMKRSVFSFFNYIPFKLPFISCSSNSNDLNSLDKENNYNFSASLNSSCIQFEKKNTDNYFGCYETNCLNNSIEIIIGQEHYFCKENILEIEINHSHIEKIYCPPYQIVCNAKEFKKKALSQVKRIDFPTRKNDNISSTDKMNVKKQSLNQIYIIGIVLLVVIVISIFIILKKKNNFEENTVFQQFI